MISKIISSYKRVQAQVSGTSSGRNKFNLILSFVTDCEKTFNSLPPFALFKDFLFILIEIILKGDINFIDPAKLTAVKQVLNESRKEFSGTKGGDIILAQIDKAVDIVNMQLLKVYFYIGKYEDGLSILNAMLREKEEYYNAPQKPEAINTKETKQRSTFSVRGKIKQAEQASRYALVNPEIYKESKAYEILSEMKAEFDRLNSFSEDHINILLVEHEGSFTGFSTGIVQNLYCETEKQRNG